MSECVSECVSECRSECVCKCKCKKDLIVPAQHLHLECATNFSNLGVC